jgi:hypothetical protein
MSIKLNDRDHYVNVWDLLTDIPTEPCRELLESRRAQGQSVKDKMNASARIFGQEMSLEATDSGWVIKVFSCFTDKGGESPDLIRVEIPKDRTQKIRVYSKEMEAVEV